MIYTFFIFSNLDISLVIVFRMYYNIIIGGDMKARVITATVLALIAIPVFIFGGFWFNLSRSFKKHDEEMERFRNRTMDTVEDEEPFNYTAWLEDDDEHYEGDQKRKDDVLVIKFKRDPEQSHIKGKLR